MKKKKSTKRSKNKYPALDHNLNLKIRHEKMDIDYLDKLSEKEKAWLNRFVNEEIHASFEGNSRDLNRSKKSKRRIYNNNNAWVRDIYTRARMLNRLDIMDEVEGDIENNQEDTLIEMYDSRFKELDDGKNSGNRRKKNRKRTDDL